MKTIVNRDHNFGKRVTSYEANVIFTDLPDEMDIDLIIIQLHSRYMTTKEVARSLNRKITFHRIGRSINADILYFETFTIDDDYWEFIEKDLNSEIKVLESILTNL